MGRDDIIMIFLSRLLATLSRKFHKEKKIVIFNLIPVYALYNTKRTLFLASKFNEEQGQS